MEISLKVAQNSFQQLDFEGCVFTTTLDHLMLQLWYQKNCPIIGEHFVVILVIQ